MRIVIDMQGAQTESRHRGIGRYTLSLALALVKIKGDHEIILALNGLFSDSIEPIRKAFDGVIPQENIKVWSAAGPLSAEFPEHKIRRQAVELLRESFIKGLQPDFVLVTSLFEGFKEDFTCSIGNLLETVPTAVILYDLIPLLDPKTYLPTPSLARWYWEAIETFKKADLLLAISNSSKNEAVEHLPFSDQDITTIYAGVDESFCQIEISEAEKTAFKEKFQITKEYLLYLGAADDRKNHIRLIEAYAGLPKALREKHQLLLVGYFSKGKRARFKKKVTSCGLAPHEVLLVEDVTNTEAVVFYNLCKAFVFPSWHEGFGLPVLEAMKCGKAVIAANSSSLPEVVGREDALFDPFDVTQILKKIQLVLEDDDFRQDLEKSGLQFAKQFSWEATAKLAITAMETFVRENKREPLALQDPSSLRKAVIAQMKGLADFEKELNLLQMAAAIAQNHPLPRAKTLFVDISELVTKDAKTGIQRVVRSIITEWVKRPPAGVQIELVYATTQHGYRYAKNFTAKLSGEIAENLDEEVIEFQGGDIFLGLDLQHHVVMAQKDYYEKLKNLGVKVWFVIYDLLPVLQPDVFPAGMLEVHQEWLENVTQGEGVICISDAVSKELDLWMADNVDQSARPLKNRFFHLGADVENSAPSKGISEDEYKTLEKIKQQTSFLSVGTIEPRKGHVQTLAAFELLWDEDLDVSLVLVGREGWNIQKLTDQIKTHPQLGKRLFWLNGISDEFLEEIYKSCSCLLAASVGEGFGLPLIEAAQHKLPILARNLPVFEEVAQEYAQYFTGFEAVDLSEAVKEWLSEYKENQHQKSTDMPWLTWAQSAKQLFKAILS